MAGRARGGGGKTAVPCLWLLLRLLRHLLLGKRVVSPSSGSPWFDGVIATMRCGAVRYGTVRYGKRRLMGGKKKKEQGMR